MTKTTYTHCQPIEQLTIFPPSPSSFYRDFRNVRLIKTLNRKAHQSKPACNEAFRFSLHERDRKRAEGFGRKKRKTQWIVGVTDVLRTSVSTKLGQSISLALKPVKPRM